MKSWARLSEFENIIRPTLFIRTPGEPGVPTARHSPRNCMRFSSKKTARPASTPQRPAGTPGVAEGSAVNRFLLEMCAFLCLLAMGLVYGRTKNTPRLTSGVDRRDRFDRRASWTERVFSGNSSRRAASTTPAHVLARRSPGMERKGSSRTGGGSGCVGKARAFRK